MPIKSDKRPSHYECALMSQHVYKGNQLKARATLPADSSWKIREVIPGAAGFFAAIYVNAERNQVVVAYRGTDNLAGWIEDLKGVFLNYADTPQKELAFAAAERAKDMALELNAQLTFTGHSLGAYLAELSVFYIQVHLTEGFIEDDYDIRHYVSAVTFESPGTQEIMAHLQSQLPQEKRDLSQLDITEYVSYPNLINTCNQHVGTLYSLDQRIQEPTFFNQWNGGHLQEVHSIDGIVNLFHAAVDHHIPRTAMTNWPRGGQRQYFFDQVEFVKDTNKDIGQYCWKQDYAELKKKFVLTMNGQYQYDATLSKKQVLALRHFSPLMQEWLTLFYAQLKHCDKEQRAEVKGRWATAQIEPYIIGYLTSTQLLKRGIGESSVYICTCEPENASEVTLTAEQFREKISAWLSDPNSKAKVAQITQILSQVLSAALTESSKVVGSVEAVLFESGAELAETGRIDVAKLRTLTVNIPLDTDEANIQKFQKITRDFMDNIAQSGLRVRAVAFEKGAKIRGTINNLNVSAVEFNVNNPGATAAEAAHKISQAQFINSQRQRAGITTSSSSVSNVSFDNDEQSKKKVFLPQLT